MSRIKIQYIQSKSDIKWMKEKRKDENRVRDRWWSDEPPQGLLKMKAGESSFGWYNCPGNLHHYQISDHEIVTKPTDSTLLSVIKDSVCWS